MKKIVIILMVAMALSSVAAFAKPRPSRTVTCKQWRVRVLVVENVEKGKISTGTGSNWQNLPVDVPPQLWEDLEDNEYIDLDFRRCNPEKPLW